MDFPNNQHSTAKGNVKNLDFYFYNPKQINIKKLKKNTKKRMGDAIVFHVIINQVSGSSINTTSQEPNKIFMSGT